MRVFLIHGTRLDGVPVLEVPGIHSFLMNRTDVFAAIKELFSQFPNHPTGC